MLEVIQQSISIKNNRKYIPITDSISWNLKEGETLGIVGESGCGKSISMYSLMGLLDSKSTRVTADEMTWMGKDNVKKDMLLLSEKDWRKIRGNEISMIFQNPMSSLNPLMTCGKQIQEILQIHHKESRVTSYKTTLDLLQKMEMPDPEKNAKKYPYQLSGGMRQRVMIAMALACKPRLLIADEPTTALDVTVQAQILKLMKSLIQENNMSFILITHDFGVVRNMVDKVAVMYAGHIVEWGRTEDILNHPAHPYTKGLLGSIPRIHYTKEQAKLKPIEGSVPTPNNFPKGCRFEPRCSNPVKDASCKLPSAIELNYFDNTLRKSDEKMQGHQRYSTCQYWESVYYE